MLLQLVAIICVFGEAATTGAKTVSLAKNGCPDKCGDISIPYPFGLGANCYYDEWYAIDCNTSFSPPKPFLTKFNLEIIQMFREDVLVNMPMGINCTRDDPTWTSTDLSGSPYRFDEGENVFVTVGCNGSSLRYYQYDKISASCAAICEDRSDYEYDYLDCRSTLQNALTVYSVNISTNNRVCSYPVLLDTSYLPQFHQNGRCVPVSLSWTVMNSKNSSSPISAPSSNLYCYSPASQGVSGYLCSCEDGWDGNPYLPNGCQEVEKCKHCRGDCIRRGDDWDADPIYDCYDNKRKWVLIVILGLSIGFGLIVFFLGGFCLCIYVRRNKQKKQKARYFKRNGGLLLQQQMSSDDGVVERTKIFTARELEGATDNFNESRILGQGGQGTVYKGMLTDGRIVAIKKSRIVDEDQSEQFINEVVILSQINHRNVVKLLGCCLETEVPLLVYEFIPNGTLFEHIHYPSEEFPITWEMRLQISMDAACALAYLHSASSMPIYHRDIKSSNILLDEKYRGKLSDFGTSRYIPIDKTHLTTRVLGTFGYLDPEYFQSNQFTEKSDVYSFGVVLIELLTGQKPIRSTGDDEQRSLVTFFLMNVGTSHLIDILDPKVVKEGREEEILAVADLARRCLTLDGKQRPTMKVVATELEAIKSHNAAPPMHQNFPAAGQEVVEIRERNYDGFSSSGVSSYEDKSSDSVDIHPLLFSSV